MKIPLDLRHLENIINSERNLIEEIELLIDLKQLEKDIKTMKTQSRSIQVLEEKLKMHQDIRKMEKKRNELRANLWQSQDEEDKRKESFTTRGSLFY